MLARTTQGILIGMSRLKTGPRFAVTISFMPIPSPHFTTDTSARRKPCPISPNGTGKNHCWLGSGSIPIRARSRAESL